MTYVKKSSQGTTGSFLFQYGRKVWILYDDGNTGSFSYRPSLDYLLKKPVKFTAGSISVYMHLHCLGGILADATKKYKLVILSGILIMFAGYIIMAVPGMTLTITIIGLFTIALGNGLFKGNLQAVVGQMYDDPKYAKLRDSAFMIFYMGINVGAFFAPFAATGMRNWWLKTNGFAHDGSLPSLCHQFINGTLTDTSTFTASG